MRSPSLFGVTLLLVNGLLTGSSGVARAQALPIRHTVHASVGSFSRWVLRPGSGGGAPILTLVTNDPHLRARSASIQPSLPRRIPTELPSGDSIQGVVYLRRVEPEVVVLTAALP